MSNYVLNIGLDSVDRGHYLIDLPLQSGPPVAKELNALFLKKGFNDLDTGPLIDAQATSKILIDKMETFQKKLVEGDLLVVTFCGHTAAIKKSLKFLKNSKNEDEGWALFDRVFFHFEFWELLREFSAGVKIILLVDSCYSGAMESIIRKHKALHDPPIFLEKHKKYYNTILTNSGKPMHYEVPPAVAIITSSAENQKAQQIQDSNKLTFFHEAFKKEIEQEQKNKSLTNFFDNMSYSMQLIQELYRTPQKSFAQFFYLQGHKHTDLRTQTPPFGDN